MKETIVHILNRGIKQNQKFIYQQITLLKKYRSVVVGPYKKGENFYPFKEFYDLREIDDFPAFLQSINAVAIHAHHGGEAVEFLPLVKNVNIPYIVSIRGRDGSAQYPALGKNFRRYYELKEVGTAFFPVCHYLAKEMRKLGFAKEKLKVLYGGIDLKQFPFNKHTLPNKGEIRIVSVGRLVEKKGFSTLIKAFEKVYKNHPRTTLHIIGFGKEEKKLQQLINKAQLTKVVTIHGQRSSEQIATEIKRSHIFCLASQTATDGDVEGIPNALKEAMASGIPVVSTTSAGIPELISHLETGYVAKEKNISSVASGIEYFINNKDKWGKITTAARKTIEKNFHLEKQIKRQEMLYGEIIKNFNKKNPS